MLKYKGHTTLKLRDKETGIETEATIEVNLLKPISLVQLVWDLIKDYDVEVIN